MTDAMKRSLLKNRESITGQATALTVAAVGTLVAVAAKVILNKHDYNTTRVVYHDKDSDVVVSEELSWENELRDKIHRNDPATERKEVKSWFKKNK